MVRVSASLNILHFRYLAFDNQFSRSFAFYFIHSYAWRPFQQFKTKGSYIQHCELSYNLLEYALHADFAIVKAWKGDKYGNLIFRKTTRNFSTSMAKAGNITIAEVEHLVEPGELEPDSVHVAGIYVHRIFQGNRYEKRIERKTVRLLNGK